MKIQMQLPEKITEDLFTFQSVQTSHGRLDDTSSNPTSGDTTSTVSLSGTHLAM